jgi:DNA-binding response OmpR family regulator
MTAPRARVLLIEDDSTLARLLRMNLEASGYRVARADDGRGGLAAIDEFAPDLVLLDLMLPDTDGYEVCRRIRQESDLPVIMLTAKGEERHKVHGLLLGADDYVTKPFSAPELLARIATVLRRARRREEGAAPLTAGDLVIDFTVHRVFRSGRPVPLTATESRLLRVLAANPGRVVLQEELLRRVWGAGCEGDSDLLRTTVRRLRRKLGNSATGEVIQNVRGIGYALHPDGNGASTPPS